MNKTKIIVVVSVVIGLVVGYFIGGNSTDSSIYNSVKVKQATKIDSSKAKIKWTCSMHPQIIRDEPGKCPICSMDLIPLKQESDSDESSINSIKLSPNGELLAEVETQEVVRQFVAKELSMVGIINYDETKVSTITARVPGRIDKLFVNYTGLTVKKGEHLAEYYSPDLLLAQQELLIAKESADKGDFSYLNGVTKKLELWGLTKKNIEKILSTGKVMDHIVLYPHNSGVVIDKPAVEGKYFKTGDRLFTVADLSEVWVNLDAYERDIQWLRYGQKVRFTSVAYPGKTFEGRIAFIDPVLDPKTRVVKVRVNAANKQGLLKPGMFVHATVLSKISDVGKVVDSSLAGKWICPMHPSVVKDEAGVCEICGMNLIKADALGYISSEDANSEAPMVIPASAPLLTGKRAVVYVKDPKRKGRYEGRVVTLGQRVGNYYIVRAGLSVGEFVVTRGNFKIDSALQIQAKQSMMSADQPKEVSSIDIDDKFSVPSKFREQLDMVLNSYYLIEGGLSNDDMQKAKAGANKLIKMLSHIEATVLNEESKKLWGKTEKELKSISNKIVISKSIKSMRESFLNLSSTVESMVRTFGTSGNVAVIKFHCPMAFNNKGGDWFQSKKGTLNPYFGKTMQGCGDLVEEISK